MRTFLSTSAAQIIGLCLLTLWVLDIQTILDTQTYLGQETRDLFDHIALLDQWNWHIDVWNYPNGGDLIPPDFFSMVFALPWWSFGRGIAYDLSITTHVLLNVISGWYLAKTIGGSGWVGGIAILASPFLIGQINSGETETIGLWGIVFTLAMLVQKRWVLAGLLGFVTAIGSWYYGAYIGLAMAGWSLSYVRKDNLRPLLAPLTFALLILIPAFIYANMLSNPEQMFRGPSMNTYLQEHPRALIAFSSDPTLWFSEVSEGTTHIQTLGWTIPILAFWGWFSNRRTLDWRWGVLLIASLSLSLGPRLHWDQQAIWEWMPYDLLLWIPPLDSMRLPHRWMVLIPIVFCVWISRIGTQAPLLISFLLLGETVLFQPPLASTIIPIPSIISHFEGPVLQLPARTMEQDARGRYLVMQRSHQQPIPYSLLMQGWSTDIGTEPFVVAFTKLDSLDPIASRTVEARQFRQEEFALAVTAWNGFPESKPQVETQQRLNTLGFSQVCYHRDLVDPDDRENMESFLLETLGNPDISDSEGWLWTL